MLLSFSNAAAVNLFKWVDKDGKVSYQDSPPPKGQGYEEKSFSGGVSGAAKSPEVLRAKAARENPAVLYIASNCDSCDLVRSILKSNQIPFTEKDAEKDAIAQSELIKLVGAVRVPSLSIGKDVVNGYNRNAVQDALKKNGYPPADAATE